jgi:hypothetical protein
MQIALHLSSHTRQLSDLTSHDHIQVQLATHIVNVVAFIADSHDLLDLALHCPWDLIHVLGLRNRLRVRINEDSRERSKNE